MDEENNPETGNIDSPIVPVPRNFQKEVNYGYDVSLEAEEEDKEKDWQLFSGYFYKERYDNLVNCRPDGEKQMGKYIDTWMCVLFSLCKCIAYRMNWRMKHRMGIEERAWLESHKFINDGKFNASDLFLGIVAGVKQYRGTSMKNGIETARLKGLLSEINFPFRTEAKNWQEMTEYPTSYQLTNALKFINKYTFHYENVGTSIKDMRKALPFGPLWVAGHAWRNRQANGIYPRVESRANHCFVVDKYVEIAGPNNDYWEAPDSYPTSDNNFIKKLAWNYNFAYVKQLDVEYLLEDKEKHVPKYSAPKDGVITPDGTKFEQGDKLSFWEMFKAIFYETFKGLGKKLGGIFNK